jgi:peptidoglycan/LPS O-acetylase OafA/YrhL
MTAEIQAAIPRSGDVAQDVAPRTGHLDALDALRGMAIGFVVFGHYVPYNIVRGDAALVLAPFAVGGVILFFMLSGFLIDHNLERDGHIVRYALRRIFRIIPAYWTAIAIILLFERFVTHSHSYGLREILLNLTLLSDVFPAPLISAVFWTLLIEVKFYAIAPIIKWFGDRVTFAAPFITVALNLLVFVTRGEASHVLTYLTFCFAGMQFSLWYRDKISPRQLGLVVAMVVVASLVFLRYYTIGLTLFTVANFMALWLGLARKRPMFDVPALRFVGAVSYSWYLYHAAIGYAVIAALRGESLGTVAGAIAIAAIATLALAWVSYRTVERPGIELGRALERRFKDS